MTFYFLDERVGQLCCVTANAEIANVVHTQLKVIARRMWSNPPYHGARIVATALNNPTLYQEWFVIIIVIITIVATLGWIILSP